MQVNEAGYRDRHNMSGVDANSKDADTILVSVAYAPEVNDQQYLELKVPKNASILDILQISGLLAKNNDLAIWCQDHADDHCVSQKHWLVGIFAQKKLLSDTVKPYDRIEVYRGLIRDPVNQRSLRRQRKTNSGKNS